MSNSSTGSAYLDRLVVEGRITSPAGNPADLPEPSSTGDWDGTDSTNVVAELRAECRDLTT
jgi:hypothetical protein